MEAQAGFALAIGAHPEIRDELAEMRWHVRLSQTMGGLYTNVLNTSTEILPAFSQSHNCCFEVARARTQSSAAATQSRLSCLAIMRTASPSASWPWSPTRSAG